MNKEESGSIPVPTTGEALHTVQDSAAPAIGSEANEQLMYTSHEQVPASPPSPKRSWRRKVSGAVAERVSSI